MSNELDIAYRLTKELMRLRKELPKWAQLFRQEKFSRSHEMEMMQRALEIDKLLRFLGMDWVEEYERKGTKEIEQK